MQRNGSNPDVGALPVFSNGASPGSLEKRPYFWGKKYFSDLEIEELCNYRNHGTDNSLTYKYILSPTYDMLLPLVPTWMAPNTITLIGLVSVLIGNLLTAVYVPTLQEEAPRWVYLLLWIGLASYRVLDNLDGRQARRTGSSSPLGHLFDHGCDTLNVFLSGLNCTAALKLGSKSFYSLGLVWLVAMGQFFGATLEEFFNGALNLGYINGPSEGILLIEAMYLASFLFGPSIWEAPLSIGTWQIRRGELFFWVLLPISTLTVLANYVSIWKKAIADNKRRDILDSLRASIPFLLFSFCLVTWQQTSTAYEKHPHLFLWCTGINFFYLISRLIVAHLTNTKFPTVMGVQLVMAIGAANAVAGIFVGSKDGLLDQYVLLWLLLGVEVLVNCRRVMGMTREICSHLGIECFRIKSREAPVSTKVI